MNNSPSSKQPFAKIVQSHVDPEDYSVEWGSTSVGMYSKSEASMWAAHMNEAYEAGRAAVSESHE